jgi:ATP-dependent helicase/DNAse subunit B
MLPPSFAALLQERSFTVPVVEPEEDYLETTVRQYHKDPSWWGKIPTAAISPENQPRRISVTELEVLAQCPYRFYAQVLSHWKGLCPQVFARELDALELGRLIHFLLEKLFQPALNAGENLSTLVADFLKDDARELKRKVGELAEKSSPVLSLLPPALRRAQLVRLWETLAAYCSAIEDGSCADARPLAEEVKIRCPFPGLEFLLVSGQIDRVDDRQGQLHIVDYKSGKSPSVSKAQREKEIRLGFRLQPTLYPWLYRDDKELADSPSFSYIFLGNHPPQEVSVEEAENPNRLLATLSQLLLAGHYFPICDQTLEEWGLGKMSSCRHCELDSLCRRFDPAYPAKSKAFFRSLAVDRYLLMTGPKPFGEANARE